MRRRGRARRWRSVNPEAEQQRSLFRILGLISTLLGAGLILAGVTSHFRAMGGGGPPERLWMTFAGMPFLAVGIHLLRLGFMQAYKRYVAGETAPIASDVLRDFVHESSGSLRSAAGAVAGGLRGEPASHACPSCGHANDEDARFCDQCAEPLADEKLCTVCKRPNDLDARFCKACGVRMSRG